jgi:uncharacterized protein (DUF2267 family)
LDHTVPLTHLWIDDLGNRLRWNSKARSYRLLKAVLHALRDLLRANEVSTSVCNSRAFCAAPITSNGDQLPCP